jgi:predicted dehydrogenase
MIKVGIIGYGYWGPNLTRNFYTSDHYQVELVCDAKPERRQLAQRTYPSIDVTDQPEGIFSNTEIDAVAIATPFFLHYELGKKALESNKHVLIEKPMTSTIEEGEELINLANQKGKVLMVDHTFLYTGAVKKIKEVVDNDEIGNIEYFDSTRINLGLFQSDINVVWDLAPHDLSILLHLVDEKPYSVIATGIAHTKTQLENLAYITVKFQNNKLAHFTCSWTSPVKIRKILIGGDKKMIIFDDVEPAEKVKIYNTGYTVESDEDRRKILVDYRVGDIYTPKVEDTEALTGVVQDFADAINKANIRLVIGKAALTWSKFWKLQMSR